LYFLSVVCALLTPSESAATMSSILERRYTHRFKLSVPLVFCPINTPSASGHSARSINISERGVFFNTKHPVFLGLPVRVLLDMPTRFKQRCRSRCLFTGRVTHIERKGFTPGTFGVGVEFFYSEPVTDEISESIRTLAKFVAEDRILE
jgi:Tfp pilus assembly protein PilZ